MPPTIKQCTLDIDSTRKAQLPIADIFKHGTSRQLVATE